jgi:hypothetical protein
MRVLALLLLAACAPDLESPAALPADALAVPTGRHLTLGVSRLVTGGTLTLRASGALPGEVVNFARGSTYSAQASCLLPLDGLCLNLANPALIGTAVANANGVATLQLALPNGAPPPNAHVMFTAVVINPDDTQSDVQSRDATAAPGPYAVGVTDPLETFSSHAPDYLLGNPLMVVDGGDLVSFGMYANATGARGRLALYTDNGGQPGRLIASTGPFTVASGQQTESPTAPANIQPGNYWIFGLYDTNAAPGMGTADPYLPVAYYSQPFGSALPNTLGAPQVYTGQGFNYYLVLR